MTHAGTIDLGGSAQSKQGGSPWAAIALTLALVVAMIGAVWFASNAGLVGGTAKPGDDRSYDQIEAQRGAVTLSSDVYLNGILDRAHATPYVGGAATVPLSATSGTFHATPVAGAATLPPSATSGTFHATPVAGGAATLPPSATSGTFHAGKDQPWRRPSGIASAARSHTVSVAERGSDAYLRPSFRSHASSTKTPEVPLSARRPTIPVSQAGSVTARSVAYSRHRAPQTESQGPA